LSRTSEQIIAPRAAFALVCVAVGFVAAAFSLVRVAVGFVAAAFSLVCVAVGFVAAAFSLVCVAVTNHRAGGAPPFVFKGGAFEFGVVGARHAVPIVSAVPRSRHYPTLLTLP